MQLPVTDLVGDREGEAPLVPLQRAVHADPLFVEPSRAEHVTDADHFLEVGHLEVQLEVSLHDLVHVDGRLYVLIFPPGVVDQELSSGALDLRRGEVRYLDRLQLHHPFSFFAFSSSSISFSDEMLLSWVRRMNSGMPGSAFM